MPVPDAASPARCGRGGAGRCSRRPAIASPAVRAFVTGGSGFVGTWLLAHLRECGDEVDAPIVDILDRPALDAALAAASPDVVYHLAGQADVGGSWRDPVATFQVNATGTVHVLDAARRLARPPRVLVVGSADVYGTVVADDLPLREDRPLRPASPYAGSKAAAEQVALQAWLGWGLPVVRVRAFNHIGPGQSDAFVVSGLARQIAEAEVRGEGEVLVGNLAARRDFTDVRDVVRAYRLLAIDGEPGGVYNVCTGVDVAIADLAERLVASARVPLELVADPARFRPVDVPVLRGDPTRLVAATGWRPEHDVDRTVADVLAWWRGQVG